MKVAYARYVLKARFPLNAASNQIERQGALLRIQFDSNLVGYADCHPWPELGDLPLEQQLKGIAQKQFTPLTNCALSLARLDAVGRAQGKLLLKDRRLPLSHFLVPHFLEWTTQDVQAIVLQGYTHVKLKVGRQLDEEAACLMSLFGQSSLKIRLDFNEKLTLDSFRAFLKQIVSLKNQIDFIEDPFPFQPHDWQVIQQEGWSLACDRQAPLACDYPQAAEVLIIKPARQMTEEWSRETTQKRVVTSYVAHPLEQVSAAYVASQLDPAGVHVHGLLSHHVYESNHFSRQLNAEGPHFSFPKGSGWGFDRDLEQMEWTRL
jgi:O-succinylbenzoate synthase